MLGSIALFLAKPVSSQTVKRKPDGRVTLENRTTTAKRDNWEKAIFSIEPKRIYSAGRGTVNEPFQASSNNWDLMNETYRDRTYATPTVKYPEPLSTSPGDWDLLYGSLNYNGDRDWLKVNCGRESWSRIRDLGMMDWSDDIDVPILPVLPCQRFTIPPPGSGKQIADEDVNPHIAKPVAGHMYVIQRKKVMRRSNPTKMKWVSDYYILFRVEELKPNETCTITWKKISTPKK